MPTLSIDNFNKLQLEIQTLVGRSVAVLGITGSGKTNTAAVLIEEVLSHGLPLTIVDIEGEYWGLKERFEILVAGRSAHAEIEVSPESAGKLAEVSIKRGISVILDLSEFTQEEAYAFLIEYFKSLWAVSTATRQPYQIVLEEAHEFVPQGTSTPLKQILTRIALRGRKRGLGIILVSQRSAKVEKDVLTQTSLLFLHKVVHPIDLKVYKDLIPLPAGEVEDIVRKLQPGEAIMLYNHQASVVRLRLRYTFHVGSTPTFSAVAQPKLRKLDERMLKELQGLLATTQQEGISKDERKMLAQRIEELEEAVALRDAEIEKLKSQIDLLSKLTVSIEGWRNLPNISSLQQVEVDQAIVGQITGSKTLEPASPGSITLPQLRNSDVAHYESSLSAAEQRKFDSLVRRIQKLPKMQRSLLQLLAEHEGTFMTVPVIASWLSLKESTVRNHPPHDLLKMRLITRVRGKSGYRYTSALASYLRGEFHQTDLQLFFRELFSS